MNPIRKWKQDREDEKARQFTQDVADGFWEMYHVAMTFHGRYRMSRVIYAADKGELELDPKILGMYKLVMMAAPYKVYATLN